MTRRRGWLLASAVWLVLLSAMALGLAACTDPTASVEADILRSYPGTPSGLVVEAVGARTSSGEVVWVGLSEDGTPLFVGAAWWSPTLDYVEASGGQCGGYP
jgi:hypothetical protein